jgi:hypothetical protein
VFPDLRFAVRNSHFAMLSMLDVPMPHGQADPHTLL